MAKTKILIADDDPSAFEIIECILQDANYIPIQVSRSDEIFLKVKKEMPDVVLLDICMPGMDGFAVKNKLNEDKTTSNIPVIFVSAKDTIEDKIAALGLGAYDYVTKPYDTYELLARIEAVLNRKRYYDDISMKDEVTNLHNMHFFRPQMKLFFDLARRYRKGFSLAIVDIDYFKSINDHQGHAAGDAVLKTVANLLYNSLRKTDILARYGGDEFIILLPETNMEQALIVINKIKEKVSGGVSVIDKNKRVTRVHISFGICEYDESFQSETQIFEKADASLYEHKRSKLLK